MPKRSSALLSTDREVAGAALPAIGRKYAEYRIAGTPNLVLRVSAQGRRSWVYWVKRPKTNRWQKLTLGGYPTKRLALARQDALRHKRSVLDGVDPIEAREEARRALTVRALGEAYIKRHAKPKKRSWRDDQRKLEREVYVQLGNARADQITKADLVALLNRIHDRGAPIQANRTLALLRKLCNWAVAEGYISASPALGIPTRAPEKARTRTLSDSELITFWRSLDAGALEEITTDVLRLQLLLGARVREVTGMERTELALDDAVPLWTLPRARAKAGRDVPRPLPPLALNILRRRLKSAGNSPFVFPSPVDPLQPFTARAPSNALRRAGEAGRILPLAAMAKSKGKLGVVDRLKRAALWRATGFTPHDLRRTCRTRLAKLCVRETVAKKILGHAPPRSDVTASVYDQHTYIPEMLQALELWECHLLDMVARKGTDMFVVVE